MPIASTQMVVSCVFVIMDGLETELFVKVNTSVDVILNSTTIINYAHINRC